MYIFSGGEPLVRKQDILRLCTERAGDCQFLAFTNATLIDEAFAAEMLRVKNFIPAISVEGFEEATDRRRGAGASRPSCGPWRSWKTASPALGASCCYTSQNVDSISSEAFIDHLVDCGAKFAWFFHYMPVGNEAVPDLLRIPHSGRACTTESGSTAPRTKYFTIDFQNDGQYVGGCIAGGRNYLHINANGDMSPGLHPLL